MTTELVMIIMVVLIVCLSLAVYILWCFWKREVKEAEEERADYDRLHMDLLRSQAGATRSEDGYQATLLAIVELRADKHEDALKIERLTAELASADENVRVGKRFIEQHDASIKALRTHVTALQQEIAGEA